MPIEIKELHIKAVVAARDNVSRSWDERTTKSEYDKMRKELMRDCIEKILQILDDKKER